MTGGFTFDDFSGHSGASSALIGYFLLALVHKLLKIVQISVLDLLIHFIQSGNCGKFHFLHVIVLKKFLFLAFELESKLPITPLNFSTDFVYGGLKAEGWLDRIYIFCR